LDRASRGAVSVCGGQVMRHAVAPVTVELALVAASNWRDGLEVAGRFAPKWWRPNTAEPDHGARVSDLRPGDELISLDGDAHKDLVAGADVPVSSPGWLTRTSL